MAESNKKHRKRVLAEIVEAIGMLFGPDDEIEQQAQRKKKKKALKALIKKMELRRADLVALLEVGVLEGAEREQVQRHVHTLNNQIRRARRALG
jgi:hypothetical protein